MPQTAIKDLIEEIQIEEQKVYDGKLFPLALTPRNDAQELQDLTSLLNYIRSERTYFDKLLIDNGAILFRGFPITNAFQFDAFVKAFGGEPLDYIGGAAPRNKVIGDVYTTNEAPPESPIPFHHEMAQVPVFPSRLFFYCDVPPAAGGQTPLALSHVVYQRMLKKHPSFVAKLEKEGVIYTRILSEGDDTESSVGRGWKSTFLTEDKSIAEQRAAQQGIFVEWLPKGNLKTVTSVTPGVRFDERHGRKTWFNSIYASYTGCRDARNVPEKAITFGDGTPMPAYVMKDLGEILNDVAVAVNWQKGDVIWVDNRQALHARRYFTPPRLILAALLK